MDDRRLLELDAADLFALLTEHVTEEQAMEIVDEIQRRYVLLLLGLTEPVR